MLRALQTFEFHDKELKGRARFCGSEIFGGSRNGFEGKFVGKSHERCATYKLTTVSLASCLLLATEPMDNIRAYGTGLAGGQFDAGTFFRKPTVIFRSIALVLAALLWFSISKGGWHRLNGSSHHQFSPPDDSLYAASSPATINYEEVNSNRNREAHQGKADDIAKFDEICLYGSSASTCSFASALGFFSLVGAGALLLSDARFERVSSIPTRKRIVTGDLAVSAIFAVIFLIAFFTFWSKYSSFDLDEPYSTGYAKFGILLAFLSTLAWGGAAFFAWRRYEEGAVTALGTNFDNEFSGIDGEVQDGYGYGGSSEGTIGVENSRT
ncbi:synaptophysin / synaptoporin [Teladorsagia circumcincta]|uniref:Synaptophysin / synaptoporin n=1 Tax=Teladorsagia circumcincta TaxID=45464 RepID=A0A2G9V530_TELCI|nr:synaptophysin / synaptoporin [Teladorsagia circumcincta]